MAQAPSEALLHLRVDEPVGQAVLEGERRPAAELPCCRSALSRLPTRIAHSIRRRLDARRLGERRRDCGMHLLVHAGHAREDRRPHLRHRPGDVQRVGQEGDRVAQVRPGEVHQPTEVVREREVEEHDVARAARVREAVSGRDHRVVVPVADHAALRRARRSGRVDEREQVLLVDRGDCLRRARPGFASAVLAALLFERRQVGEREHVAEPWERRPAASTFARCASSSQRTPTASEWLEDVVHVVRRRVRVDRGPDRADVREREVEQRPLERVPREDAEGVALADAAREEAVREVRRPAPPPRPMAPPATCRLARRGSRSPVFRATASRQRRGIVRFPGIYGSTLDGGDGPSTPKTAVRP